MENMIDTVAVYGTLKKDFSNHGIMNVARGEYVGIDYIQFDKLDSFGFPMVKLSKDSGRWLEVELYRVPIDGIEGPLDSLEGYTPGLEDYNLYNRIKTTTKNNKDVWIYEIVRDITDRGEEYFVSSEGENTLFYNWK